MLPPIQESRPTQVVRANPTKLIEVTEDEYIQIKKHSDDSLYLNFAILLLSSGLSTLIAYLLIDPTGLTMPVLCFLYCVIGIGFLGGIFLMVLWNNKRKMKGGIFHRIDQRLEAMHKQEEAQELSLPPIKLNEYQKAIG